MTHFEKAPAKINLSLDVLRKREDGYHDVEMVMTTVDLADRIELNTLEEDRIEVSLWSRYVPNDERNLAYKAAKAFKQKYNINKGVHIKIEKVIPVSAGLGGGSTDAAAVLRGLNRLWNMDIPIEQLAELGSTLGSDIPFCVYGSTGIAKGFGEIIEPLPSPPPFWVVLAKPDIGVSTRTIFQRVKMDEIIHPNTNQVVEALYEKDFNKLCQNIGNSLEAITTALHPEVLRIKEKMLHAGASGVLMSGSGPTVYGLVEQQSKAQRIYNGMKGFCQEVYLVRLIG
ncbi:4-(cytidine 5'-diphospho)-2-C-methyl-D-erythritol kinase [Ornithinibacillus massiliensis]|uniref:4-diphosphocytidyl-2-C-methyl-D-erythritol kinase n=1 Tax=Ornithinibacillus massiliensis TaxID=1944633 RepID=A0ABS5M8I8_9BACI|nr:4-(cytidine 5'-diphospho)-2-C-methyl-D-erythritol kinase [Ornithinibacillus massiliensis]MBS3678625.1 4-(cytidine 5'-diphospho)-2-C-methyl-D-erythritol kinase [Ornithinibacillus massiliensis]